METEMKEEVSNGFREMKEEVGNGFRDERRGQ